MLCFCFVFSLVVATTNLLLIPLLIELRSCWVRVAPRPLSSTENFADAKFLSTDASSRCQTVTPRQNKVDVN